MSGSGLMGQLGVAHESEYGTFVSPTRWIEATEGIKPLRERIRSTGPRSGSRTVRADRSLPWTKGAAGPISHDVLVRGWGFWLKHMLGSVSTSSIDSDGMYTHTATVGTLRGKSFSCQIGRPFADSDTVSPVTLAGGKITKWTLTSQIGSPLAFTADCDFKSYTDSTALASASYPTNIAEPLTFLGGSVTIGGSAVDITDVSISGTNPMKADRFKQGGAKKEPLENGLRSIEWALGVDWTSLTQNNRVLSSTQSGTRAEIVCTWLGLTVVGNSVPALTVTIPLADFMDGVPNLAGPEVLEYALTGDALAAADGTSAIRIYYKTLDSTAA